MSEQQWVKLTEWQYDGIGKGAVFRFFGKQHYEEYVDYLLYQPHQKDVSLGIIVASGHKAGHMVQYLPGEAKHEKYADCIRTSWLKENWCKWVYPDCSPDEVYVLENYPTPEAPNTKDRD